MNARKPERFASLQQFVAFYFAAAFILFGVGLLGMLTGSIGNLPTLAVVFGAAVGFLAIGQTMTLLLSIEANTRRTAVYVQQLTLRSPRNRTIVSRRSFP